MSAILTDIQPGDEVIIPSFTFVSTVNAFVLRGARPRFIDIREDTLNLDETLLEQHLTNRTRVIVPVHYAGVGCEMDEIQKFSEKNGLKIIEDNAHGLLGKYKDRMLGTFGCLATQSFHETKNFTSGEGGALIINDPDLIERAEIIREKGTNRSRFFRGQVDKYTWVDEGSSYLPSEILAAYLTAQLEERERIQARRWEIWHYYDKHLSGWAKQHGVRQPFVPTHTDQSYHMYYLLMPDLVSRTALINHLKEKEIMAVFHYLPLNTSPMGVKFQSSPCPVTERISDQLVRLPFYTGMTDDELDRVVNAVFSFEG
jgi:dTDP-4-amino-4,6-dideoxygalactose transaminase